MELFFDFSVFSLWPSIGVSYVSRAYCMCLTYCKPAGCSAVLLTAETIVMVGSDVVKEVE